MKSIFRFLSLLSRFGKYKDRPARGPLARLLRDEDGSYLIFGTVMLPIMIGVAGLATEGGLVFYNHRGLQNAADAAAYSAAIAYSYSTTADVTTQAKAIVASYGYALGTGTNQANVTATATTFDTRPAVRVNISRSQSAIFSSIYLSVLTNSVSATAVVNGGASGTGNCLVAMGMNPITGTNDLPSSIALQGNPTLDMGRCGVFSNSTDCTPAGGVSVALGGNATLNAGSVGSAGCISVTGSSEICTTTGITQTCSPPGQSYTQSDGTISDPYAGISVPTTGSTGVCSSGTCSPGVYNGDLPKNVTLQPGVYIFTNGLTVKNSSVTGTGVTLVFTSATPGTPSSYKGFSFEANADVTLTAPTTGPTAGFVMMGDPNMPYNTMFSTQSNPTANLSGTVYLPKAELDWQGGPDWPDNPAHCLQMIVNKITMQGNPGITNSNCNNGLLPGQKAIGSKVTLVQ